MNSVSQKPLTENNIESKQYMSIPIKNAFVGTLASFAFLALVASPSQAESRTTNTNATTGSNTERQISQATPSSPTQQQQDDKGCPCCKKMMGNTQQMDNKMQQMMNGQQNPPR